MEQGRLVSRAAAVAAASAFVYYALARVGLELTLSGTASCPIWPASGFALAGATAFGPAAALGVFAGSWLANVHVLSGPDATTASLLACVAVALGSAVQALFGARLLGARLSGPDPLATSKDVLLFGALTPVACLTAATIGVAALVLAGQTPAALAGRAWLTWWIGDVVGVLIVAPLLFAWRPRPSDEFGEPISPVRALIAAGTIATLCVAFWLGFGEPFHVGAHYPLSFLPFAVLIWITLALESRGATAGAAILAALAQWYTVNGRGPFAAGTELNESLLVASVYLALAALTAFLLRAVLAERRAALAGLKEARAALERRVHAQSEDLWTANASLRVASLGRREDGKRIQLYRHLVGEIPVGLMILRLENPRDPDSWVIVEMNPAGQRLANTQEEDPAGRRLLDFAPNLRGSDVPRACTEAMRQNRCVELADFIAEDRVPGAHFSIKIFPLGAPLIGIVYENVTAQKAAEEALARSNKELSQFAYVASHDLQAPLRKAAAFAQQLENRLGPGLDDMNREFMTRLGRSLEGMQTLIDALLQLARVATHAAPHRTVELGPIVADVLADFEETIKRSGASVTVTALPAVNADPSQMRQLLQNLIGNALKFAPPGRGAVVRVSGRAVPAGRCELRVEDEGVGFEMRFAERAFLPFQRLHSAKDYPGTGMGLAICSKIVERHGGSIATDSEVGRGTIFTVVLPAATPAAAPPPLENALG